MGSPPINLACDISCPWCAFTSSERMPVDYCQARYECRGCAALLKPKPGDCCVFCSYGTTPCPPVQQHGKACCDEPTPP